ncbi:hypothetical protein [uncultured Microbacterium sp.]|uniref:hypothetical protein n=1 Tax=uncultured Microbacterium sp. TaxID=191216 RepID=UPI0028DC7ECE|nr:hypothetical protein [uncultured Microbacterium sp.]
MLTVVVHIAVAAIAGWLAVEAAYYARKHPNRDRRHPDRLRLLKILPITGWIFVVVGLPLLLLADASRSEDRVGMAITASAILTAGVVFVVMYRNWYVAFDDEQVTFRTLLGVTRTFRYSDIADYAVTRSDQGPVLTVRTTRGVRLRLNIRRYDAAPLLAHLRFHRATGRWAVSGELRR